MFYISRCSVNETVCVVIGSEGLGEHLQAHQEFDNENKIRFIVLKKVMLNNNNSFQVPSSCYIIVNAAKSGFLRTLESVDAADYCIRLNCENHLVTHDTDYEDDVLLMIFLQWFTSEDKNRKSNDNDNDNIFNNNNIDDDVFICIYLCPASTYDHAYHDEIFLKTLEFQKKQEYCTSLHTTSTIFHVMECYKTYKTIHLLCYDNHDDLKQQYNIIYMDMNIKIKEIYLKQLLQ